MKKKPRREMALNSQKVPWMPIGDFNWYSKVIESCSMNRNWAVMQKPDALSTVTSGT